MMQTIVHYGVKYPDQHRPVGPFGSYEAAKTYIEVNPWRGADPEIVERITLIGAWEPATPPRSEP